MWKFVKRHKIWSLILVLSVAAIGYPVLRPAKPVQRDVMTVSKTSVMQEIDVTGRVGSAEQIDLAVEVGGKVKTISAKVGDKVVAGQVLLSVDDADLQIRLNRQKAALRKTQIALADLKDPVSNLDRIQAENRLSDAYQDRENAGEDLLKAYEDGFNVVSDAFLDLPSALNELNDIMDQNYLSANTIQAIYDEDSIDYRDAAIDYIYDAEALHDDVVDEYQAANRESDNAVIKALIDRTYSLAKLVADSNKSVGNLLDYVEDEANTPPVSLAGDQDTVADLTSDINTHLLALLDIRNTIKTSEDEIYNSDRLIAERKASYDDIVGGADNYDVETLQLDVQQAQFDIDDTLDQISERTIISPIDGIVTAVNADVGEVITSAMITASVISESKYQVEANLPEADLDKVKLNAQADINLDTYGSEVTFKAVVVAIDPAETIVEGVATYKITLHFSEADDRIKSGMTADISVKGERKDNVLAVPQRAVINKNGSRIVRVLKNDVITEKPVKTGLRGTDGNIEITDGLSQGEQVIVFIEE